MHWISQSEKEMIIEWAKEFCTEDLTNQYLPMPNKAINSYWCKYSDDNEIMDYDFDTLPELKTMLEQELKDEFYEELLLPLTVAAFKEKVIIQANIQAEKDSNDIGKYSVQDNDSFSIPDFVYMF